MAKSHIFETFVNKFYNLKLMIMVVGILLLLNFGWLKLVDTI
jgi:hypothetical protein